MIGLVASLLTGVVLGRWVFALSFIPVLLRLRGRDAALIAFYLYVLALLPYLSGLSVFTRQGLVLALSVSLSTFLLLDEVLRGASFGREELLLSGILAVSALYDYTFLSVLFVVTLYVSFRRFGKVSFYLIGWFALFALAFLILGGSLREPASQALMIIGLAMLFLLAAERREVDLSEGRPFGKDG